MSWMNQDWRESRRFVTLHVGQVSSSSKHTDGSLGMKRFVMGDYLPATAYGIYCSIESLDAKLLDEAAVRLAAFSLYIAYLNYQSPQAIRSAGAIAPTNSRG